MSAKKAIQIQRDTQKLLSSSAYVFKPVYALYFESPAEALIYQQLLYRAVTSTKKDPNKLSVRFSYTKLAKMFSYSRKWIIETIKKLVKKGVIEVECNGRVNTIIFKSIDMNIVETPNNRAAMMVFPELLEKLGLLAAIALQQIHIRHYNKPKDYFVVRSFQQLHSEIFMYVSMSTVKRLFSRLEKLKLIIKKKYEDEIGDVNSYRVDYENVASLLGIYYLKPKNGHW